VWIRADIFVWWYEKKSDSAFFLLYTEEQEGDSRPPHTSAYNIFYIMYYIVSQSQARDVTLKQKETSPDPLFWCCPDPECAGVYMVPSKGKSVLSVS
jgi:hypothetical protein